MITLLKKASLYPNRIDIKSILISFAIINFTFLYHSLNFIWGNHDVEFIKNPLPITHGFFEGRFTQFISTYILTNQNILPILNNFIGFIFLTLGLWLLAKYWKIPQNTLNYTIFITFFATQPYTLSWLYFNLNTISIFLWIFVIILGLYFSELIYKSSHKIPLFIYSILCFYLALGGYPPIINTIAICLCGNIIILYLTNNTTIFQIWHIHKYTLLNILISIILYKLTILLISPDNVYNLETTPLNKLFSKFIDITKIAFNQFFITQPFMGKSYKLTLFIMSITSLFLTLLSIKNIQKSLIFTLFLCISILSTALTTLISSAPTQYVFRIDFYGYAFLYLLFLALLLVSTYKLGKSLALIFALILIPANIINCCHSQKIWKQGFDAELKILDRTIERIENHPNFNPLNKYRIYQIGEISLRPSYYKQKFNKTDDFMLEIAYTPRWKCHELLDLYSPFSYIDKSQAILTTDITPDVYDFFANHAAVWPHQNSVYLDDNIIIIIYNYQELQSFKQKIKDFYK